MATAARRMPGDAPWWHVPLGPLGAGVVVFAIGLLFGADRLEAAWYGTLAASFGLAYVLLVVIPRNGRCAALVAVPLFLLLVATRWVFGRDLIGASASAFGMVAVSLALGASRRRQARGDAGGPATALHRRGKDSAGAA